MQHVAMPQLAGGPASGLRWLLASKLTDKYDFGTVYQTRPAGGINLSIIKEMAAQIRAFKPDLLHVRGLQNEGFHGMLAGRLARCPRIVVSVHGTLADDMCMNPVNRFIAKNFLETATLWWADGTYCVSEYQTRQFRFRHFSRHPFGYIPNVVPQIKPDVSREQVRRDLGIDQDAIVCISVARLTYDKGFSFLAQAMPQILAKTKRKVVFLVVGDGSYMPQFREQVGPLVNSGQAVITGSRKDVINLMAASDIMLFPTLHENFANVLLEAGSAGLCVVTSDVGGNSQMVIDQTHGLLIQPGDVDALTSCALRVIDNDQQRQSMARNLNQHVNTAFGPDVVFGKIDAVYQAVLSR
jgi:glycosyltransferase involved in cell wall biosynthesis